MRKLVKNGGRRAGKSSAIQKAIEDLKKYKIDTSTFNRSEDAVLYALYGHTVKPPNYEEGAKRMREERKMFMFGFAYGMRVNDFEQVRVNTDNTWQDAEVVEPLALPPSNVTATRKRTRLKAIKVFST